MIAGRRALLRFVGMAWVSAFSATISGCESKSTSHKIVQPEEFGAMGDGVADETKAVQAAIDRAAKFGGRVRLRGAYAVEKPLHPRSGVTLDFTAGSRLERRFSGGALLQNEDLRTKVGRFRIRGPGTIAAKDHTLRGPAVFLWGDQLDLSDFTVDTYAGGQAILIGGNHNSLARLTIRNPENTFGTGGIRMFGGTDFRASRCHVVSGDDALQFTPISDRGHPLRDLSISHSSFDSCTGGSTVARFAVAILATSPPGGMSMNATISNVSFRRCQGFASRRAVVLSNMDSVGELREITVECRVRIRDGLTAQPRGQVLIERGDSAGRVRSIRLTHTQIGSSVTTGLVVRGHASSGHLIEGIAIDASQISAPSRPVPTIEILGATGVRMADCTIVGNGRSPVLTGGVADAASSGLEILRTTVTGIAGDFAGVRLPQTENFRVEDCLFQGAPGALGGVGISVGGSSGGGVVRQNQFSDLSAPGVQGNLRNVDVHDNTVTR